MTLPASGALTFAQIAAEAGTAFPLSVPNATWRTLAGVPAGALVFPTHFHGKSSFEFLGLAGAAGQAIGGLNFGGAGPTRTVFAAIHYEGSAGSVPTFTSVTIGGVAAAIMVGNANRNTATSAIVGSAIAFATVPSGTSGTISFTVSTGSVSACAIGTYREVRAISNGGAGSDDANSATKPATLSVACPSNGTIIAVSTLSGVTAISWPAGPNAEPYNSTVGGIQVSGRYQQGFGSGVYNVQSSWASGDLGMALVAMAFNN